MNSMAIILNQVLEVPMSNRNKTFYFNNGCTLVDGNVFLVPIHILPAASRVLVELKCDICGVHFNKSYRIIAKQKNHTCGYKCRKLYFSQEKPSTRNRVNVSCTSCNSEFERIESKVKRNKNNFCSKTCADNFLKEFGQGRPKVKRFEIHCSNCNQLTYKTEKRLKNQELHFCSVKCSSEFKRPSRRKLLERECHTCKKLLLLPPHRIKNSIRSFCSQKCRTVWMRESDEYKKIAYRGRSVTLTCSNPECTATFKRRISTIKNENFCSSSCSGKIIFSRYPSNPSKEKIEVRCYNCSKIKKVPESVFKKNKYFFCSQRCYQAKRFDITDRIFTMTSIHKKTNVLLNDLNIKFQNEKQIGLYSLDVYLPSYNVGIEVMGDYWHANPKKYKNNTELNSIQIKTISKDERKKDRVIKKEGIRILYLWEEDINKHEELCKNLILRFINTEDMEMHSYNWCFDERKRVLSKNESSEVVYE